MDGDFSFWALERENQRECERVWFSALKKQREKTKLGELRRADVGFLRIQVSDFFSEKRLFIYFHGDLKKKKNALDEE